MSIMDIIMSKFCRKTPQKGVNGLAFCDDDKLAIEVVISAVAAFHLPGMSRYQARIDPSVVIPSYDAPWLSVIAPPASGKSEIANLIESLAEGGLSLAVKHGRVGPQAFSSGYIDEGSGTRVCVATSIDQKVCVIGEFGSVGAIDHEAKSFCISLKEIYDGEYKRASGPREDVIPVDTLMLLFAVYPTY